MSSAYRAGRARATATAAPPPRPAVAEPAEEPIGPNLKRGSPLVPVRSAENRALVAVIAILAFLAALSACAAELVAAASRQWQGSISREMTIQVRPLPQRDTEADVARAAALTRAAPGIARVDILSKAESERLLEPWLGAGLDLSELPVPRLVILKLDPNTALDVAALRQTLSRELPSATLDDHGLWLARLSTMAHAIVAAAIGAVVLVFMAAGLAVTFATRGAVAANREVVEVLHFVGADDAFIARAFQRRFFRIGLKGAAIGGIGAVLFLVACDALSARWSATAAGGQLEALFGSFDLGWAGYGSVVLVTLMAASMTGIVSRITVRRFLREPGGQPRR